MHLPVICSDGAKTFNIFLIQKIKPEAGYQFINFRYSLFFVLNFDSSKLLS